MSTGDAREAHPAAYREEELNPLEYLGVWLRTRSVRRLIRKTRPRRLLDLGCGFDAGVLITLEGKVADRVGVDLETDPELANRPGLTLHDASVEQALVDFERESFDTVLLLSVLEHLPDPQVVLDGIHRALRPGGQAIVHVPTWIGKPVLEFLAFRTGVIDHDSINDHRSYYRKAELWPMLVKAGFEPADIDMGYNTIGCALTTVLTKKRD